MDDDDKNLPLVFANKVILQFAENFGNSKEIKNQDYLVMRLTFRKLGGNWFDLCHGSVPQILLLTKVVKNWAKN